MTRLVQFLQSLLTNMRPSTGTASQSIPCGLRENSLSFEEATWRTCVQLLIAHPSTFSCTSHQMVLIEPCRGMYQFGYLAALVNQASDCVVSSDVGQLQTCPCEALPLSLATSEIKSLWFFPTSRNAIQPCAVLLYFLPTTVHHCAILPAIIEPLLHRK